MHSWWIIADIYYKIEIIYIGYNNTKMDGDSDYEYIDSEEEKEKEVVEEIILAETKSKLNVTINGIKIVLVNYENEIHVTSDSYNMTNLVHVYIKKHYITWSTIDLVQLMNAIECIGLCTCCGRPYKTLCCTTFTCRTIWTERKFYPSLETELNTSPLKLDIILNIVYWAIHCDADPLRIMDNFSPFPITLRHHGEHSYDYIKESFQNFMSIDVLNTLNKSHLYPTLRESCYALGLLHGHMHDAFEWLISSTYATLKIVDDATTIRTRWKLPDNGCIVEINDYQTTDNSIPVFHGCPVHCLHGILKNGLRVYSGTKNAIHGAVHGTGIYVSTLFDEAQRYSSDQCTNWPLSSIKINKCVFLCDVHGDVKNVGTMKIVNNSNQLVLRYLYLNIIQF